MPWKESVAIEERLRFVQDALSDRFAMSELCAALSVNCSTKLLGAAVGFNSSLGSTLRHARTSRKQGLP
jgi:hypothetical protein